MKINKHIKNIFILIVISALVIWGLNYYFQITPLLTLVVGLTLIIFIGVAVYHRGINIEEIEYELLRDKRFNEDPNVYLKFLRRSESLLEDKIIESAERGKPRDKKLEDKLELVQIEKAKTIKLVDFKKRQA